MVKYNFVPPPLEITYFVDKNKYSKDKLTSQSFRFRLIKETNRYELSFFETQNLTEIEIKAKKPNNDFIGYCTIKENTISEFEELHNKEYFIDPDNKPERHLNLYLLVSQQLQEETESFDTFKRRIEVYLRLIFNNNCKYYSI